MVRPRSKNVVFSKIFKLDENNEYRFAMTKPLPIGIFKKEPSVSMDKSIGNFDPNAKIGEIFAVDIEFDSFDDPQKRMYNEVFPVSLSQRGRSV